MGYPSVSSAACGESALLASCAVWTLSAAMSIAGAAASFSRGYPHEQ
jgi:hypothetical protein